MNPFVGRGPDGLWHLLATGDATGPNQSRPHLANAAPSAWQPLTVWKALTGVATSASRAANRGTLPGPEPRPILPRQNPPDFRPQTGQSLDSNHVDLVIEDMGRKLPALMRGRADCCTRMAKSTCLRWRAGLISKASFACLKGKGLQIIELRVVPRDRDPAA
jgi:hypothetical protein